MTSAPETQSNGSEAIVEIERLNFRYHEVAQYDLTQLSTDRRVQVRETKHYAPQETVGQYAIQMGRKPFPPIVVTSDGWIVDGNTRVDARKVRKEGFCTAIVLDVKYIDTTDAKRDLLHALAATLNQQGSLRLTSKEVRNVAERLVRLGWKSEEIGRAIGLQSSGVTAVKREIDAVAKLKKVGLDDVETRAASLRALGNATVVSLNDLPFKELAELAVDAGFNATEITTTAKAVKESGSDEAGIEMIHALRKENGDRIAEHKLTGSGKPALARQLRQRLGFITKFAGRERELLETNPEAKAAYVEALEQAIAVLGEALQQQRV
jgi:hypothetical protein